MRINSLLFMMKRAYLCKFYCPSSPRDPVAAPGRAKKCTFHMAVTQSLVSISKRKLVGQLFMLCLLNNVEQRFLTCMERRYKSILKSAHSKIPNFILTLKYVIEVCTGLYNEHI